MIFQHIINMATVPCTTIINQQTGKRKEGRERKTLSPLHSLSIALFISYFLEKNGFFLKTEKIIPGNFLFFLGFMSGDSAVIVCLDPQIVLWKDKTAFVYFFKQWHWYREQPLILPYLSRHFKTKVGA